VGEDYSLNSEIWDLVEDSSRQSMILYPGVKSVNLSPMKSAERAALIDPDRRLTMFVIDGTWATARKMVRLSINLHLLPRICFTPPAPSNFRVRKQPNENCFSTIEAIHHTIELLGPAVGFKNENDETDSLLDVFDKMIQRQLELTHTNLHVKRA
jgi:DTW domain-containing protein